MFANGHEARLPDPARHARWFSPARRSDSAALRLYCLPYAGGSAALFRTWGRQLDRRIEVSALELPGHGRRLAEAPCDRAEPLAGLITAALLADIDRPFALFGHSMGGLLAYEVAHLLSAQGRIAEHLFISARKAPHLPDRQPPTHVMGVEEFKNRLGAMNGTPREALGNPELMGVFLPILRADFMLCETHAYRPCPPLAMPISTFGGTRDETVKAEDLQAWSGYGAAAFRLRMFEGDHFFIRTAETELLEAVGADLAVRIG